MAITIILLILAPTQLIIIGPSATLGRELSIVKYGSKTFDINSLLYKITDINIERILVIINAINQLKAASLKGGKGGKSSSGNRSGSTSGGGNKGVRTASNVNALAALQGDNGAVPVQPTQNHEAEQETPVEQEEQQEERQMQEEEREILAYWWFEAVSWRQYLLSLALFCVQFLKNK